MNYTTIEQSKRLIKLGLSPDTADMFYSRRPTGKSEYSVFPDFKHEGKLEVFTKVDLPCWSLDAMLNIIPNYHLQTQVNGKIGILFGCKNELKIIEADTVINTVFQMVVWLLENGYIKTENK
jgi:hypothetical protein